MRSAKRSAGSTAIPAVRLGNEEGRLDRLIALPADRFGYLRGELLGRRGFASVGTAGDLWFQDGAESAGNRFRSEFGPAATVRL